MESFKLQLLNRTLIGSKDNPSQSPFSRLNLKTKDSEKLTHNQAIISDQLRLDSKLQSKAIEDINRGIDAANLAEDAMSSLEEVSERRLELAELGEEEGLSNNQRDALQEEIDILTDEFSRIVSESEYNGQRLFSDNSSLSIQSASGGESAITLSFLPSNFPSSQVSLDLSTSSTSSNAVAIVTQDLEVIAQGAGKVAGVKRRLETSLEIVSASKSINQFSLSSYEEADSLSRNISSKIKKDIIDISDLHSGLLAERVGFLLMEE